MGPLEWANWRGVSKVHEFMAQLQTITGSDLYCLRLWPSRRAQFALPAHRPA
jgi:hypothetical protein